MRVELIKTYQFEAAHSLGGKLHGHSYIVDILCEGSCDKRLGWLVDYGEITAAFDPYYRMLDHNRLENVDGMTDTSLLCIQLWLNKRLRKTVPHFRSAKVRIVGDCKFAPRELHASESHVDSPHLRFWFESAHYLPNVPEDHKCRRMHGHSFCVDVATNGKLRDLEPYLENVYHSLDRQCLNNVPGLENATSEQIARWIWDVLVLRTPSLRSVTVAETCTARCVYRGNKKTKERKRGPDLPPAVSDAIAG